MERPGYFQPPLSAKKRRTPRDNAIAAWRRVDLKDEEKAMANNAKALSTLMPGVLKGLGLERKQSDLEILRVWNHLIDPQVAAHAKPVSLAKGTLFVNVDSSVWLDEIIRYRSREILRLLRHSFGPDLIRKISYRVG